VAEDPCAAELVVGGSPVFCGERCSGVAEASGGFVIFPEEASAAGGRPCHGSDAPGEALVERAIEDRVAVERAEFDLIGDEWLVHEAAQGIELGRGVIGNADRAGLAGLEELIEPGGGVFRVGEPVGPVDEEEVEGFEAEEAQGWRWCCRRKCGVPGGIRRGRRYRPW
jgi:hypothetical protein